MKFVSVIAFHSGAVFPMTCIVKVFESEEYKFESFTDIFIV